MSKKSVAPGPDAPSEIVVDLGTVDERGDLLTALGALAVQVTQPKPADQDLTSRQAAAILGLARPDGTPRDSFYRLTKELGGYRVTGGLRFPRASVEAFKRRGGAR